MPIRAENRARYPADWPQISRRRRAGWGRAGPADRRDGRNRRDRMTKDDTIPEVQALVDALRRARNYITGPMIDRQGPLLRQIDAALTAWDGSNGGATGGGTGC